MDLKALIATYEARKPLYTEGDFVRRFAQIENARAIDISGRTAGRAPDEWMIALLASGRVSDAEYFRLAGLLGVDSAGLIHAEPAVEYSVVAQLRAGGTALLQLLSKLRRA